MNNDNKKIPLPLAKLIDVEHKRLGIEVESEWYWTKPSGMVLRPYQFEEWILHGIKHETLEQYPAHDQQELFKMIGLDIPLDKVAELVYNSLKKEEVWNGKISKPMKAIIKSAIMDKLDEWMEQ